MKDKDDNKNIPVDPNQPRKPEGDQPSEPPREPNQNNDRSKYDAANVYWWNRFYVAI